MDYDQEQLRIDLGRRKSGTTTCSNCSRAYNNRCVPKYCSCFYFLGGNFQKKEVQLDAKMLTQSIASIRTNVAGLNNRSFVSLGNNTKVTTTFWFNTFIIIVNIVLCFFNQKAESSAATVDFNEKEANTVFD